MSSGTTNGASAHPQEDDARAAKGMNVFSQHRNKLLLGSLLAVLCVFVAVVVTGVVKKNSSSSGATSSIISPEDQGPPMTSASASPSSFPSTSPPSEAPTNSPSAAPSFSPTNSPSEAPTPLLPSAEPTLSPTAGPTLYPSSGPTAGPTLYPSSGPTAGPTLYPSTEPTNLPSESPSSVPSSPPLFIEPNPVPRNPKPGYFNYDINDSDYGPNAWDKVDTSNHLVLREFGPNGWGTWKNALQTDPTENRCQDYRHWRSPRNLMQLDGVPTGSGQVDGYCDAFHEIRSRCGSFPIESEEYKKYILPHKLTVIMNRRQCRDPSQEECNIDRPPVVDYPQYSGTADGLSDLINWDIKVPGEHKIYNETFDAEIQMLHAHLDNEKLTTLGIPVRATKDAYSADFQRVLDQFHDIHFQDTQACLNRRNLRQQQDVTKYYEDLMEQGKHDGWYNEHTARIMLNPESMRNLQSSFRFDPYSEEFMVDMFYFRYRGSMTEPPCMYLTWFFMDKPMLISFDQLRQVKFLLFTHVDPETCEKTSVHNADQSVARPIQPVYDDDETSWTQHCIAGTFESDLDRFGRPGRKCS